MKRKVLFILIFNGIFFSGICQGPAFTLKYADKLFAEANYSEALKEYQRYIFFNHDENNSRVYEKIADCFFSVKNYDYAAEYYEHAFFLYKNDSLKNELIFKKAKCYLLTSRYHNSLAELYSISDTLKGYFFLKKNFYLGVSYFGLENFGEAKNYFINAIDSSFIEQRKEVSDAFRIRKLMSPYPKRAQIMSIILPGSGQIYAGDIKDGLNSLILTGGFLTLGYFVAVKYTFIDGALTAGPWFQRYWAGGISNAYNLALKTREKKRNIVYNKVLSIIGSTRK